MISDILGDELGVLLHSVVEVDLGEGSSKVLYDPSPWGFPLKRGSSSSMLQSFDAQSPCPLISAMPSSRQNSRFQLLRSDLAAFCAAFLAALRDERFSRADSKSSTHAITGALNASAKVGTIPVFIVGKWSLNNVSSDRTASSLVSRWTISLRGSLRSLRKG